MPHKDAGKGKVSAAFGGKVALVTGAGSGIGQALAVELSRRGCRLLLLGRRRDALEQTRALLANPGEAFLLEADLASAVSRESLASRVRGCCQRLDILVNNAGMVATGPLESQDEQAWRAMIEVNLLAPMIVTRALLPLLEESGNGQVVNIGSMFGDIAFPFFAAYSASKFGLRGWTEALRRELDGRPVSVTWCAPRGTQTPAADGFRRYVDAFAMKLDPPERIARRICDGIAAGARDVYPAGPERLFLLVQRLFPRRIDAALGQQLRNARNGGVLSGQEHMRDYSRP